MPDIELLKLCYAEHSAKVPVYETMYAYYKGDTKAMKSYKMVTERSSNKTSCNFIKKFIKEEAWC